MFARPPHILCPPDIADPDFHARYCAWTAQMRAETKETIAHTKQTIAESRALLQQADRLLARKGA
jgi:hypothetical protein